VSKKKKTRKQRPRRSSRRPTVQRRDLPLADLKAILAKAKAGPLNAEDCDQLEAAVDTLAFLTRELEAKGASIKRLRKLIFGASTEKTSQVFPDRNDEREGEPASDADGDHGDGAAAPDTDGDAGDASSKPKPKPKRKGHGRRGAAEYTGADKVPVPHDTLKHGDPCPAPGCDTGRVYRQADPAVLVRVTGMAPLMATVYELERLRCHLCGEVFTAEAPMDVGPQKYDETAAAMIGLLKYGCGFPFNRLQRLQDSLGIPMPAGTQWDVVARAADLLQPAHDELIRQAAQGEVIHNDDTTAKILDLDLTAPMDHEPADQKSKRTGVFTTGIVAAGEGHRIALFFTGRQHAGENLADVLARRAADLSPPIQMSDALSRNAPGDFDTIEANCLAHGRRRFVDVKDNFPEECRHVLEALRDVYHNDSIAREREMADEERLAFHQQHSKTGMDELQKWLKKQIKDHLVEPNSGLGEAIQYMLDHWDELTLFLHVPGAPLDNNICERALKKAILHRKNAYFFKTENGARVADLFMGLIHTAELEKINPFDYLVALQRHHEIVAINPDQWMPWNFMEALARLTPSPLPPT